MLVALLSCFLLVTGTRAMRDFIRRAPFRGLGTRARRLFRRLLDRKRYVQAKRLQALYRRSTSTGWHPDGYTQPGEHR